MIDHDDRDEHTTSEPRTDRVSLRSELEAAMVIEESEHAIGWNAALREAIAIFERRDHVRITNSQRVTEQLRIEGKKVGGEMPYGYELDADGMTLRESRAEQNVIRLAIRLKKTTGMSLRSISADLSGRGHRARNGKPFSAQQIKRILDGNG